ncbi:MAG: DUF1778 domain-containing protein [Planctomycetota bacterium]
MSQTEPKTARIDARLPEAVHLLLQKAAALQGRTLTDFVVTSAREAAELAIARHEVIELSNQDQERFVDSLLNPAPIADAMKRAASKHASHIQPS